jgi:acetyl-CoA C-acetyltransferase
MRGGARIGHQKTYDHMFLDGLEDAYDKGRLMGTFAEDCAEAFQFTRDQQDDYALGSLSNALAAIESGAFDAEVAPVTVKSRKGETRDRHRRTAGQRAPRKDPAAEARLPRGRHGHRGQFLVDLRRRRGAGALPRRGRRSEGPADPRAHPRPCLPRAGAVAVPHRAGPRARKLLDRIGWRSSDVDLWEVNEAFAVVPMAFMQELGVPREKMNVNGGACALGHPIGASGARIMVTLLNALEARGLKRGVAAICIGGGEGTAIAIERT